MTRSLFGGSATPVFALLATIIVFDLATTTSQAVAPPQHPAAHLSVGTTEHNNTPSDSAASAKTTDEPTPEPAQTFVATAYSLRGRTASGQYVRRGIIAADRRVLPLGTRVRLSAGSQSGEYVVADTGGAVRGRKIDIWVPSTSEAMRFGRRNVQLTVLQYPRGKGAAKNSIQNLTRARRTQVAK